jgi:hypothetical protein
MVSTHTAGFIPSESRRDAEKERKRLARELRKSTATPLDLVTDWPASKMPATGHRRPQNLRGPRLANPPAHRGSSDQVGGAYLTLAATGEPFTGPYIGDDLLSLGPFSFDSWDAYAAGKIRSQSTCIIGVKGTGKSMLGKSWASRSIRLGRKVAVPHDPNGEWGRVADYVGGVTLRLGPGHSARINLLDPGLRPNGMSDEDWNFDVLQYRRRVLRAAIALLRGTTALADEEHTALDLAVEYAQRRNSELILPMLYEEVTNPDPEYAAKVGDAGVRLGHTLRRLVEGDVSGQLDRPTTVRFDAQTPMVVVDDSAVSSASDTTRSLIRMATTNWIDRGTPVGRDQTRIVIHEEAAAALLGEVASGSSLTERVADEKVARHHGKSNWYLIHRIADFDSLGDEGSAMHSRALGLLADCEIRVSYAQHVGELERSAKVLGWNQTQTEMVGGLRIGEGFWQIGQNAEAKVRNVIHPNEMPHFTTDAKAGQRG